MTNGQCAVGGLPKILVRRAYSKTIEIELLDKVVTVLEDTDVASKTTGLQAHLHNFSGLAESGRLQ